MPYLPLSVTTRSVLRELDEQDRVRAERLSEHPNGYTESPRVELAGLESRSDASTVLNPPEARRFFSSRLSR